jgi:hypothetical protein
MHLDNFLLFAVNIALRSRPEEEGAVQLLLGLLKLNRAMKTETEGSLLLICSCSLRMFSSLLLVLRLTPYNNPFKP